MEPCCYLLYPNIRILHINSMYDFFLCKDFPFKLERLNKRILVVFNVYIIRSLKCLVQILLIGRSKKGFELVRSVLFNQGLDGHKILVLNIVIRINNILF